MEKKKGSLLLWIFLFIVVMGVLFVVFPFFETGAHAEEILYELFIPFIETEFSELVEGLKSLQTSTLIETSAYASAVLLVVNFLIMLLNRMSPIKIGLLKFLNHLLNFVSLVVIGFGIYAVVMTMIDETSTVTLTYFAYGYYGVGLLATLLSFAFLKKKKEKK